MSSTLNQDQLFEIAEWGQKSALMDWLRWNGIKYTVTRKGRVMTTLEQINSALVANDKALENVASSSPDGEGASCLRVDARYRLKRIRGKD